MKRLVGFSSIGRSRSRDIKNVETADDQPSRGAVAHRGNGDNSSSHGSQNKMLAKQPGDSRHAGDDQSAPERPARAVQQKSAKGGHKEDRDQQRREHGERLRPGQRPKELQVAAGQERTPAES